MNTTNLPALYRAARRKVQLSTWRWLFRVSAQPSVLDVSSLQASLADSPNILFLCHGNICRSPLAERYLSARLEDNDALDAAVDSAGLRTEHGKRSPADAITAASEFGVDLTDHGATPLSDEYIEWSDVIFIKDVSNYRLLRRHFDGWEGGTYFLGALTPTQSYEIRDPYGSGINGYRTLYSSVVTAVDALVELLELCQGAENDRGPGRAIENNGD